MLHTGALGNSQYTKVFHTITQTITGCSGATQYLLSIWLLAWHEPDVAHGFAQQTILNSLI